MTPVSVEETARRLGRRAGHRLVTYREVGLSFWEMPLRCRLLARAETPTIDEFVIRCIDAELLRPEEVAQFLGLPLRVLEVAMGRLVTSGHIVPTPPDSEGEIRYILSERGRHTLADSVEIVPVERTLPVSFDGLLRRFTLVDPTLRWRPRDLKQHDILPIPALPADPPDVGPPDTAGVAAALSRATDPSDHELLSVLGLAGKREQFFVRAIALVFESTEDGEVSVHFAIDGRPSEEHDLAFARAEGKKKLGILGALADGSSPADHLLSVETLSRRSNDPETQALRRATETLQEFWIDKYRHKCVDKGHHDQSWGRRVSEANRRRLTPDERPAV